MAVLIVAATLRLHGLAFGLPAANDPDELMFELGAVRMLTGRTLNPGWFGHPATTTMYLLAVIDVLVFAGGWLAGRFAGVGAFTGALYADPGLVMLPHRVAMVLFGLGSVALTARLARRIWARELGPSSATWAGLSAAALLAISPIYVTWSQVIRSDVMACLFLVLTLTSCIDIAERGRPKDWVRAAGWLAVSVATKWPFALGALGIIGATMLQLRKGAPPTRTIGMLLLTGMLALLFLMTISPYLLLAYPTVLTDIVGEAQQQHLGATGGTPLENLVWYARGPLFNGLGLGGIVLAILGLWVGRKNLCLLVIVLPVALGFVTALMFQHIVWERWALPLMPLLAILAGGGFAWTAQWFKLHAPPVGSYIAIALLLLLGVVPPIYESWARTTERIHDTRQQAALWAHAHIADGQSILVEHFAFDLLDRKWRILFPLGDRGCVDARALLAGRVQYSTIQRGRGNRANVDYGTVDPGASANCATDWAIVTQADRYRAEASRFPSGWAAYRSLFASADLVATFAPVKGQSGGPVVRIIRRKK